ncbi:MAG: hypothetical protein WKG07_14170 [Hymenobacter sp.]
MSALLTTALIAAPPTLFRQGLVALLREHWPQLLFTLTTDASQVAELVAHHAFGLLVLDGTLPGLGLPALLARLHQTRPTQRLVVLADQRPLLERGVPLPWPGTRLVVPSQVAPPRWPRPWPRGWMCCLGPRPGPLRPLPPGSRLLQPARAGSAAPGGGR